MGQKMQMQLGMKQQLRMTQQLQQAIKLLQLSRQELITSIQEEMMENPALEEAPDSESEFSRLEDGDPPVVANDTADLQSSLRNLDENISKTDTIDWDTYFNEYQTHTRMQDSNYEGFIGEEMPSYEATLTAPPTLVEYLIKQVHMTRFDETQERIALEIIGNINDDGYLTGITLEEIAEKFNVDLDSVVYVQETIQEFDPTGVGSRDLRECLLAQAEILYPDNQIVHDIINKHIPLLERKNYKQIARNLRTTVDRVIRASRIIASLNPKPGLKYCDERPMYITPDVYVEKTSDGEYHVVINDDGLPKLRVSSYYYEMLRSSKSQAEAANYIRDKMTNAKWFIRSLQQRERTIYRVAEAIINRQHDFFEKGVNYLKPMILKDIAEDTNLSESTISRVTTKKYMHTPQRTFELKYFFTSKISRMDAFGGDDLASTAVQERIKAIVSKEDPKHPLSDQKIAEILKDEDIDIARRTVAKYREVLGILSSSQRKEL
ncbi:MAG: RNA polymerase factor sigma-54 [Proteobacteria bacterium]|nr:RNA polymerase factor sigma-54 [Pseudomonadota bacterium]